MSTDNSRANQGNASPNARHSPTDHAKNRRDELARTLGRTHLYGLDYQDPDVLRGAFDAGYTISEIAAAFSIDTETVRHWMGTRGVESPRSPNQ
jgi:hypothetical protein